MEFNVELWSQAVDVSEEYVNVILTSEGEEKEIWMVQVREGKFGKEREALIHFFRPEWKVLWEKWLSRLEPDDHVFTYTMDVYMEAEREKAIEGIAERL